MGDDEAPRATPGASSKGGASSAAGSSSKGSYSTATGGAIAAAGGNVVSAGGSTCSIGSTVDDGFSDQAFVSGTPIRPTFYTWTTADQVVELRAGGDLFSRSERDGLGRGIAFDALSTYAKDSSQYGADLARVLVDSVFAKARFAWNNAWATRMGWPGESYGDQPLKIELREEAWVVWFDGYDLAVTDLQGNPIPSTVAVATPNRIGAIYFTRGGASGGPLCGTFGQAIGGGNGYREFILGNLAMVRRWSLATSELIDTISQDIKRFEKLLTLVEACPPTPYFEQWNAEVICSWRYNGPSLTPNYYINSLSLPSQYYYPDSSTLHNVIDTLRASIPQLDPLVVDLGP
jgi:hypothetical protein